MSADIFLETLNSDDYDKSVPQSVPSGLHVPGTPPRHP